MTANTEATRNRPMMLPWIARRAGISEQRAESLWHEAVANARQNAGSQENSAFWESAETYLDERIKQEQNGFCLSTPELSPLVRLQMRAARLPLLTWQGWSLAWVRLLANR